jgi:hypothetical protein
MGSCAEGGEYCYGEDCDEGVWVGCSGTVRLKFLFNTPSLSHFPHFHLSLKHHTVLTPLSLVSISRGEQQYFDPDGIPTATEGCKSNALMRCCKDLGIASELWDPRFIREFVGKWTREVWVEHVSTKKKRKVVVRKDDVVKYPFKEVKM